MQREAVNFLIPGFSKLAESYMIRSKAKAKKKKPGTPIGPETDLEFDTIAKKACDEVFAELQKSQLLEKLARYSHVSTLLNPEGER